MNQSTVLVCGMGRCGTSMVMAMLERGGLPVYGEYPAYEPDDTSMDRDMPSLLSKLGARACKILDPIRSEWPHQINAKVIWLDRNATQQAKSQIKLIRLTSGFSIPGNAWKKLRDSLIAEREENLDLLSQRCAVHITSFEAILSYPATASYEIANFLKRDLNQSAMAAVVQARSPKCAKGLEIEEAGVAASMRP